MYKLDLQPLLFEASRPGRYTAVLPACDVPDARVMNQGAEIVLGGQFQPAIEPVEPGDRLFEGSTG